MATDDGKAKTPLSLAALWARVKVFRRPLSTPWRVGLGAASIVTILVAYTLGSWHRQSEDPSDMLLPNWGQLWSQGVVPSFTPEEKGRIPLTGEQKEAVVAAGEQLIKVYFDVGREKRIEMQKQRLTALAESLTPERLKQEVARGRAIGTEYVNELTPTERERLQEEQDEALSLLSPDVRAKAEEALKKVQETVAREEDARIIRKVRLWEDIKATFGRLILGLGLSVLISFTLGLLMGCYGPIDAYLYPPMAILAKIPGTVMTALFMVIVGLNWKFYQAMILFGLIPTLTQTFYVYAKEVPEELIYKARTLGASQAESIFSVIVPNILPKVVETIRLSVGPALIFLYAAEFLYGNEGEGLGCTLRLVDKKGLIATPTAYFYLVVIAAFGFAIDWALRLAQRKLFPWYYPE